MHTIIQKVFTRNVSLRFYTKRKFCVCFEVHIPVNDQFQVVSDLFTIIFLCLRILSYNSTISLYSSLIDLARSELVTISYSKEIFEISYLASGAAPVEFITRL